MGVISFKQFPAVLVSIGMLAGVAVAGPFEDGLAAYRSGDYETALSAWRPLAEDGNASAQFNLGLMYGKGQGVPQDYDKAAEWLERAAEQGNARAQANLGLLYANGEGVAVDYAAAVKWLRPAAEQNDARAQTRLGRLYEEGDGVKRDKAEAMKWYRRAAEQDHARGQFRLGTLYDEGKGVTQDYDEAAKWFALAAKQGDADARFRLGEMYKRGEGVPQDFGTALELLAPLADAGEARAVNAIGLGYSNGEGVEKDLVEAHTWFTWSAAQGDKAGRRYLNRVENEMTSAQLAAAQHAALKIWKTLADRGVARAQYQLGIIYAAGKGKLLCDPESCVPQDLVQAHMWWNLAAAQDFKRAGKDRDRIAGKMTPDQIAEAQRRAREWTPQAGQ